MGRLIDADELLKAMDTWDKFGYSTRYGLERLDKDDKDFIPYVHYGDMLKAVNGMSTVEAIPRADYENRLKADLVAMLTELQLEIEEKRIDGSFYGEAIWDCAELIQQKINSLKEGTDGENND